jgi:hypothetical protein
MSYAPVLCLPRDESAERHNTVPGRYFIILMRVPGVSMRHVIPLGVFGDGVSWSAPDKWRESVAALSGEVPPEDRPKIAHYLRTAPVVLAFMSYTEDVLEGAFGVSGGSGVASDGRYYWRRDAAEYVEHYGTGLPVEFRLRGESMGWKTPVLTEKEVLEVDEFFSARNHSE